jgi:Holliday junction resolvase-like predicted endonuclease
MPNRAYVKGRRGEYRAIARLRSLNYIWMRSAASHGPADLIAASPDRERFVIQVKSGRAKATGQERIELKFVASRFEATAQIWTFKSRKPLEVETL